MVNLNIPIPEELHKRVKLAALMADKTLKQYIIESLEKDSNDLSTIAQQGVSE